MRRIYLLVAGLMIGILISGFLCSSVSQAGEMGNHFYSYLKKGQIEPIMELIDKEALKKHSKEEWYTIFKSRANKMGNLVSFTNTGFHTETIDGKSITKLDYTVVHSNGIIHERIDFIKRGSIYKILVYESNSIIENAIVDK